MRIIVDNRIDKKIKNESQIIKKQCSFFITERAIKPTGYVKGFFNLFECGIHLILKENVYVRFFMI